ncbi:amidase [Yinghuangia soli]|uniref:Amidase n=1 Tax=Yinghuangia soli TaxID=2908204 RepID=A0AA41U1B4_9ACTN|nr:amidase family protein [Yinghuangia soli]MCF2527357.1 amidase [Yinghuangia soli]
MEYDEYRKHDAVGLAALVASGEVKAAELLEVAIARAEQVNPRLNALVRPMYDIARERAKTSLAGPFAGVPFLLKDLAQDYAGLPTGSGSRALADTPMPAHAEVVRRWLDAGLVVFGKTNTPEFGAKGITEPDANGPTRNPWNTAHTPGGSSGGSAAAVAAGIVPAAGGNDGGGSIRIPAACCGLFGLKPGRGLVPSGPSYAEMLHGAAVNGVLTRSVRDSAAMLDVIAGHDPAGPYVPGLPELPYLELARREPGRLRISYATASPIGTDVSPEAVAAVEDAVELLRGLGHEVEEAKTGVDERQLARDFLTMWFASMAAEVDHVRRATGCGEDKFELDTRVMAAVGRATSATTYVASHNRWNEHSHRLALFHETYDLLLTPTLAHPPARVGQLATPAWMETASRVLLAVRGAGLLAKTDLVDRIADDNLRWTPYTQLANITGRPAMSVPTYWTEGGLPLGVQFVAGLGGEGLLLSLAAQIEAARPWADRTPDI